VKKKFSEVYKRVCKGAFFLNAGLFAFAYSINNFDLEVLSLVNMIFLSFAILIDRNKT